MVDAHAVRVAGSAGWAPVPHRIVRREVETSDVVTLTLEPTGDPIERPRPGQFCMLSAFGIGEIAVSFSGSPITLGTSTTHTIRAVGAVSRALHDAAPGATVGVRGPFGTTWDIAGAQGGDLLIVAGGLGLAPLRPAVLAALARRARFGRITLVVGARSNAELLYPHEIAGWHRAGLIVHQTVDVPVQGWAGEVGFVTELLERIPLDGTRTTVFACGPEAMMRGAARILSHRAVPADRIYLSLERNMQCGTGWCGHCQLGPLFVCRDGPVVPYDVVGPLLEVDQL